MISINRTDGLIGIDIRNAKLDIDASIKGNLNISTVKPRPTTRGEFPTIEIDSEATKREFGYKSGSDLIKESARKGMQAAIESIKRVASDGNRMMNIKNGVPPAIPEIAKRNSQDPPKTINLGFAGASRPKISTKGGMETNWSRGNVNVDGGEVPVQTQYYRGNVDVYLRQKPGIEIRHVDTRA